MAKWTMFRNFNIKKIDMFRPEEPEPETSDEDHEIKVVPNRSPRWQRSTKSIVLVVLTILVLISAYFLRSLISPIIFAYILTFLNKPLIRILHQKTKLSWRLSVLVVYLLLLVLTIALLTWGGIAIVSQTQNLVDFLIKTVEDFPKVLDEYQQLPSNSNGLQASVINFLQSETGGKFTESLQGFLTRLTTVFGSLLTGLASKFGWAFFVYGLSFFILYESNPNKKRELVPFIEGYDYDFFKGKQQISRIWSSFLRGQVVLMIFTILLYYIVFGILGVNYSFALALLVGIARLVPYVGSTVAFVAYGIVSYYQSWTLFNMGNLHYAILVIVIAFIIDKIMDGFLTPKMMADTLMIHPAAVLVAALVFSRFLGFVGIFLAAPITATLKLIMNYLIAKLEDQDPWVGMETVPKPIPLREMFSNSWAEMKKFAGELWLFLKRLWEIVSVTMNKWILLLKQKHKTNVTKRKGSQNDETK